MKKKGQGTKDHYGFGHEKKYESPREGKKYSPMDQ